MHFNYIFLAYLCRTLCFSRTHCTLNIMERAVTLVKVGSEDEQFAVRFHGNESWNQDVDILPKIRHSGQQDINVLLWAPLKSNSFIPEFLPV